MINAPSHGSMVVKYGPSLDLRVVVTIEDKEGKTTIRADVIDSGKFFSDVSVKAPKSALLQSSQKILEFFQGSLVDFIGKIVFVCPSDLLFTYERWKTKLKEEKRAGKVDSLRRKIAYLESDGAIAKLQSASPYSLEVRHHYIFLGDKYLQLRRYPEAAACYQKSLQNIYVFRNNSRLIGCAYGSLGVLYKEIGDVHRSLQFHCVSVDVGVQCEIPVFIMKGHLNVGAAFMCLNDSKAALDCFEKHIQLAEQMGDSDELASGYHNLGDSLDSLGRLPEAITQYEKALLLAKRSSAKGDLYINLGATYNRAGRYREALSAYQNAESHYAQDGIESPELPGALANVYSNLGEYEKALEYYQKAVMIYRKLRNRLQEATSLANLGNAYRELAHLKDEKSFLSLPKLEKNGSHPYWERAIDTYKEAYAIANELKYKTCVCTVLLNLSQTYFILGSLEESLSFFELVLSSIDRAMDPFTYAMAHEIGGKIYLSSGELDLAEASFNEYLDSASEANSLRSQANAYFHLGILERERKNFLQAAEFFRKSVGIFSKMQRSNTAEDLQKGISFFEATFYPYRLLEKTLLELLHNPSGENLNEIVPSHLEILQNSDLGKASALVNILKKKHGLEDTALISSLEIQRLVQKWQTTLIIYSCDITDIRRANCWIISQNGMISYRALHLDDLWEELNFTDKRPSYLRSFPSSKENEELCRASGRVSEYLDWLSEEPDIIRGEKTDALRAKRQNVLKLWYKSLIQPIEDLLPDRLGDRLTIIPDLTIHQLPFEAFTAPSGKALIDQFAIHMIPSIEAFLSLELVEKNKSQTRRSYSACILANPTIGEEEGLRGAEEEGRIVKQFFPHSAFFMRKEATKQNLMQHISSAGIIHLACHGKHADSQGNSIKKDKYSVFEGGLILADGLFYAEDLMDSSLNADLAILSACDSGKGKLWKEGVVGLSHAFLAAGTSSVIATRWQIPDSKTKAVMEVFYKISSQETEFSKQAKAEGRPFGKVEALREAILTVKRQSPGKVEAWGGFFLTGLPDRLPV